MQSSVSLNNRNFLLDLLKGVAIIAVILYHAGLMQYGYLGVDVFLVVSGYLTAKSILISRQQHNFCYWKYLRSRLVRIWPLALVITVVSFVGGYFTMLPVAFKNVCETTVGTSFLVNNFVQYVVSSNYWDYSNDFKPLMHTWYIGLLFQFYLVYPLLFVGRKKVVGQPLSHVMFALVFVLSLVLFLTPVMTTAQKFYLLPARLFEFCAGGMILLRNNEQVGNGGRKRGGTLVLALLLILLFITYDLEIASIRLLLIVASTAFFIACCIQIPVSINGNKSVVLRGIAYCGMASYSLYLWHQVFFAFYRYVLNEAPPLSIMSFLLILCIVAGVLSYKLLEHPLSEWMGKEVKKHNIVLTVCLFAALVTSVPSLYFYGHKGVVRDVPELGISYLSPTENQDYNERINTYDVPFENNNRKNILVIGDSYARDWFNVLLESHIDSAMNISYHRAFDEELKKRIEQSDYVFIATCTPMLNDYAKVFPMLHNKVWWRVGTKNFGRGLGYIYNKRFSADYYKQTVRVCKEDIALNEEEKHLYEHNYIELMEVIKNNNGGTPAFTPNKKLISHDGLHLTQAGAQYFAQILNVENLF